jgi:hypothetical protein
MDFHRDIIVSALGNPSWRGGKLISETDSVRIPQGFGVRA